MAISKLPRSHIPLGNINHVNAAWWGRQLSLRCSLKASQKAQLRNKLVGICCFCFEYGVDFKELKIYDVSQLLRFDEV
jgi:hypothetical protein